MKRFSFWTVIILLNAGVLWACVFVFLKFFDVSVYRKEESKFLKEMAALNLAKQPSGVSGKTETADFDFRKPHPYAGYKPQPNARYASGETFTNSLGFKSPELGPKAPGELRIAMVGGSVAFQGAPDTNAEDIIAKAAKKFEAKGIPTSWINAGALSYISNQELNVLVDDIASQDVDIVVSLDGFNDIHHIMFYNGRVGWPAFRWDNFGDVAEQTKNQCPPYYPSIKANPRNNVAIAAALNNYLENILKMSLVAKAFGMGYVAALQPLRGFGPTQCQSAAPSVDEYFDRKAAFYCQVAEVFQDWDQKRLNGGVFLNMADALADRQDVFIDECHFTLEGNERIAERLVSAIEARGLLDAAKAPKPLAIARKGFAAARTGFDFFDPKTLDAAMAVTGLRDIEFDAVGRWRWMVGPQARLAFPMDAIRPMRLRFRLSNPFPGQAVVVSVNGREVRRYEQLPATPWLASAVDDVLEFESQVGENIVTFAATLQNGAGARLDGPDQTPYALAFTALSCQ